MTPSQALPAVLDRIDANLDQSLERLFAFLRIQSVSTDPAYAAHCRTAAEFVARDLTSLGFEASVRPTKGHPTAVGTAPHRCGQAAKAFGRPRAVLWSRGRPAGRPVGPGGGAAVRAAHRDVAGRPQDHR